MAPGVFALVMATGIVSVAAVQEGHPLLSWALFAVAAAAYLALAVLVAAQGSDHRRVEALTFVAGSGVLGARLALAGDLRVALALWSLAAAAWAVLAGYAIRHLLAHETARRSGSALLAVVAPESLAVLGAILGPRLGIEGLRLAAEALWAVGLAAYALLAPGIARRLARGPFAPDDWIAMGALAIATLAAAELAEADAALALWAAATVWLPLLVLVELRGGLRGYELERWATVFPLGMYAAASYAAGTTDGIGGLVDVGTVAFWVAAAAWLLAALGLARRRGRI